MRKLIPLLFLLCACSSFEGESVRPAAGTSLDGQEVGAELLGIYGVYPEIRSPKTRAPRGFRPVYISHYGRHGSRYLILDSQLVHVSSVLDRAAADGKLTPLGHSLKERLDSVLPEMRAGDKKLTPLGAQQQRDIAGRLAANYRTLLGKNPHVVAYSSLTPRTISSMEAFLGELHDRIPGARIDSASCAEHMYYLNPHSPQNPRGIPQDQVNRGEKAPWRVEFWRYFSETLPTDAFVRRLFTDPAYAGVPYKFQMDLYYVAMDLPNFTSIRIFDVFTIDELRKLSEVDNFALYAGKGLYLRNDGRGTALAESLLDEFICRTNADLAGGDPVLRLRFGHDGCMMALFSLMGLPGWDAATGESSEIKEAYDISRVPMASNIQLVFYRGRGDVIFQCLYNEMPYRLPLEEYASPAFYRWADFVEKYTPIVIQAREFLDNTNDTD